MAVINKPANNECWRGRGEKGALVHCGWGCRLVQPLWKGVRRILKKLKVELSDDPAIPLLSIYVKKSQTNLKRYMHPYANCSIIYNSQNLEAVEEPVNRRLGKEDAAPINNEL